MEGMKFYAELAPVSSGRNEEERIIIKICNAAAVGVAKCLNIYCPAYLSWQDFEDAVADAQMTALAHINQEKGSGLAYADACGRSSAIKKCKSIKQQNGLFSPLDFLDFEGDWIYNTRAVNCPDENSADTCISDREDMAIQEAKNAIVRFCLEQLSDADRQVISLKEKKTPYKDIAKTLGCSTGAIQKRVYDITKRFDKALSQSGYYSLG